MCMRKPLYLEHRFGSEKSEKGVARGEIIRRNHSSGFAAVSKPISTFCFESRFIFCFETAQKPFGRLARQNVSEFE